MDDHRSARKILQRALAGATADGAPVSAAELERALAHLAACEDCARHFDLAEMAAWLEGREESHQMAGDEVDPLELFERALTAALSDPDTTVRERAAARLGGFDRLGAAALSALVAAARDDAHERVRAAALAALDRLDSEVSFPQRVIDAWAATPAGAADYLAGVLERLSAGEVGIAGVTRLAGKPSPAGGQHDVSLVGDEGVTGRVTRELNHVWLSVEGLPPALENTKPVVAVPKALGKGVAELAWAGGGRGLVAAADPVSGGSLRVLLGNVKEPGAGVFDKVYLLHPKGGRKRV